MCGKAAPFLKLFLFGISLIRGLASNQRKAIKNIASPVRQSLTAHQAAEPRDNIS